MIVYALHQECMGKVTQAGEEFPAAACILATPANLQKIILPTPLAESQKVEDV